MLSLSKILAPSDFSPCALPSVRYASRLAHLLHSELTLLHVVNSNDDELSAGGADPLIGRLSEGWRLRAEDLLANLLLGEIPCPSVRRVILSGNPADEIVRFAHTGRTSLIVIPTRGAGPFRPPVLGSVAARILRDADCPVLTGLHIPDASHAFPGDSLRFRKILCAVDLGPQGEKVLAWASRFAAEFEAQLTIAHITPTTEGGIGEYFDPERRLLWATETRGEQFAMQAREKVEAMQKQAGTSAGLLIHSGRDIPQAVCSAALRLEADIVLIGRGSSGAVLDRLRTKACSIIRQSPCPVLSV